MTPEAAKPQDDDEQLNRTLGRNTVQFHLDGKMPKPEAAALDKTGGTPNQKCERWANRIALFHFVNPDPDKAKKALDGTIDFFEGQLETGHQCIAGADEALTLSHAPIWWRAILSLRITSHDLASRGDRYKRLEQLVLQWLEHHTTLNALGQIRSGPKKGEIWVPAARSKLDNTDTGEKGDKSTDKVTNVIHQLMTTGAVTTKVNKNFFILSQDAPDRAGAALAMMIQKKGIGFGNVNGGSVPKLCNHLVFEQFDDGHVGRYPDGIAKDNHHAREAWAHYPSGRIDYSKDIGHIPADIKFQGQGRQREIKNT